MTQQGARARPTLSTPGTGRDRKATGFPGLEAADQGVLLRAQDHDRLVVTLDLWDPVGAGWVQAPLQHVVFPVRWWDDSVLSVPDDASGVGQGCDAALVRSSGRAFC